MDTTIAGLKASAEPLVTAYDCAMLDLDGVVYVGQRAVDGVASLLSQARAAGMTLAFVTNNAARTPQEVADHLARLGVKARPADVVTSAQAAAREVAKLVGPGGNVLVVGGEGLEAALRELDLVVVRAAADAPAAVAQGFHPDVGWRQLAEAAYAVAAGAAWVVSNTDLTIPTADGVAPGNGALVNAVAAAVGKRPGVVAGKPHRPLFDETMLRVRADRPLVVGDRLDTDIRGARACAVDSLLVLTGVTDLHTLCLAMPPERPTYVAWTLDGLMACHPLPERSGDGWELNGWVTAVDDGRLVIRRRGDDHADLLRALVSACWAWRDRHPHADVSVDTADLPPGR
jgi:glycerol-1-phosphatase